MADVLLHTDEVLAFNDGSIETNSSPIYRFPAALLRIWDNQFFFGSGARQYWLSVHALNESLLGPHEARRAGVVGILALCALAVYWGLRQFRIRPGAAAFGAGVMMLSGLSFSFAVAGLYVRPIALACAALALGFAERGRVRNGWLDYVLAGGCVGLGISEVPDVGAYFAITVAGAVAWRHIATFGWSPKALLRLALRGALLGGMALLLGWQTIANISATTIQGVTQGESKDARYAWATQWSIPPGETWDIVAGSYYGTTMSNPALPYRGGIGSSEGWEQTHQGYRNFRMSAWYVGVIPSVLLLALVPLAWRRRIGPSQVVSVGASLATPAGADERRPYGSDSCAAPPAADRGLVCLVLIGCLATLLLSWGKHFPLYRLVWSLPYFGTIRNPDKWNGPFMLFMTLGVGLALDWLLAAISQPALETKAGKTAGRSLRPYFIAAGVIGGIALLLLFGNATDRPHFVSDLTRDGYGPAAANLWTHSLWMSLKVVALAAAFAAALWWAGRQRRGAVILLAVAAALTATDMIETSRHFADRHAYKAAVASNALTSFLDAHASEGRILLLPPTSGNNPNDPNRAQIAALAQALNQIRSTMLQAKGYDLFNPVSVSRMPTDYESFFGTVGYMTPRVWELGSVRWIITVAGMNAALNQMDGDRGRFVERLALGLTMRDGAVIPVDEGPPDQRVLRVVEFTGALPKFQPVAQTIPATEGAEGERAALAQLAAPGFDPRRAAVTHVTVTGLGDATSAPATVKILREHPAEAEIQVEAQAPVLLVRSVKYDPDWVITGGGAETRPVRVNYMFQGIPVAAGAHTLVLRYAPPLGGLWVAAAGRVALLLLVLAGAWRARFGQVKAS